MQNLKSTLNRLILYEFPALEGVQVRQLLVNRITDLGTKIQLIIINTSATVFIIDLFDAFSVWGA